MPISTDDRRELLTVIASMWGTQEAVVVSVEGHPHRPAQAS